MQKATFEELLAKDGRLVYTVRGTSMLPLLHQNRDLVIIEKQRKAPQVYDAVLYRRGGSYVLHRIVDAREDGYVIRGDNTYSDETGIRQDDILGVLTGFVRNGKRISAGNRLYRLYVRSWCAIYPLRRFFLRCRRKIGRLLR